MFSIINKIFGNTNEKEIKKLSGTVEEINNYEKDIKKLTDAELREKTDKFKERLGAGETLDDLPPEVFAVVREASVRTLVCGRLTCSCWWNSSSIKGELQR